MGAGFHFPGFGAGSYLTDLGTPSGNLVRHASRAVDIFWLEPDIEPFGPSLGHFLLSFKVIRLSCSECVALGTVQSAVRDDFRHCPQHPSSSTHTANDAGPRGKLATGARRLKDGSMIGTISLHTFTVCELGPIDLGHVLSQRDCTQNSGPIA